MSLSRSGRLFWFVAGFALFADQLTKAVVRVLWNSPSVFYPVDQLVGRFVKPAYEVGESIALVGHAIQFSFVRNEGAAFGMLPGYRPLFVFTSALVLVVVAGYWRKEKPSYWPVVMALGLVTAGAVGNLIDRVLFGRVTDFIDVAAIEFPVFNIADSSIFIGVGILIMHLLFSPADAAEGADEPDSLPDDSAESS